MSLGRARSFSVPLNQPLIPMQLRCSAFLRPEKQDNSDCPGQAEKISLLLSGASKKNPFARLSTETLR
jgi:hypothetical protein